MTYRLLLLIALFFTLTFTASAQYEEACDEYIEDALMDYLGMDDLDDLFDYLDRLDDDEIDDILDAIDIEAIGEACENGDYDDDSDNNDQELESNDTSEANTDIVTMSGSLVIEALPSGLDSAFDVFEQYVDVFGIAVFATSDVPENKVLHAANVLAQYLDNDEDGQVDNALVLEALLDRQASLVMFDDENRDFENFAENAPHDDMSSQPLFAFETHPEGSQAGDFDATLEEVLHLVTTAGYANAYPDIWGEEANTEVADLMENAKDAGHYNPFANESDLPYPDQISEYVYWSLTTLLGAQNYAGRADEIRQEWSLITPEDMQNADPDMVELLIDEGYAFATVLPDGHYNP